MFSHYFILFHVLLLHFIPIFSQQEDSDFLNSETVHLIHKILTWHFLSTAEVARQKQLWSYVHSVWLLCTVSHPSHLTHQRIISRFWERSWPSCKIHTRLLWHFHYWPFRVITIFVWNFFFYDSRCSRCFLNVNHSIIQSLRIEKTTKVI